MKKCASSTADGSICGWTYSAASWGELGRVGGRRVLISHEARGIAGTEP